MLSLNTYIFLSFNFFSTWFSPLSPLMLAGKWLVGLTLRIDPVLWFFVFAPNDFVQRDAK